LAASFAGEAVVTESLAMLVEPTADLRDRLAASPLLVAYVVRWMELRDGTALEGWRALVEPRRIDA